MTTSVNVPARAFAHRPELAVFVALGIAAARWLCAEPARACKCAPPPAPDVAQGEASAVFEGRVTNIADAPGEGGEKRVTLSVVRTWKGLANDETITLGTRKDSAACGYPFDVGGSYVVYASGEAPALSVSHCSRTRSVDDAAEDLHALGAGITPVHFDADAGSLDAGTLADAATTPSQSAAPKSGGCAAGHAGSKGALLWLGIPSLAMLTRRRKRITQP